jgi:hypothetical protein
MGSSALFVSSGFPDASKTTTVCVPSAGLFIALPTEQVRTADAPAGSVGTGRAIAVGSANGFADPAGRK